MPTGWRVTALSAVPAIRSPLASTMVLEMALGSVVSIGAWENDGWANEGGMVMSGSFRGSLYYAAS